MTRIREEEEECVLLVASQILRCFLVMHQLFSIWHMLYYCAYWSV